MKVDFYYNSSENNVIGKNITLLKTLECVVKTNIDVTKPIFEVAFDDSFLEKTNYIYVKDMNRYYFISNKQRLIGNRFQISCEVDVLESFKKDILKEQVILSSSEIEGASNYLASNVWKSSVKDKTEIKVFPSGLLENGEWVLITAGG